MFISSNSQSTRINTKLMRITITWFCDVNDDMSLHSVSDIYGMLQYSVYYIVRVILWRCQFSRIKRIM